MKYFAEFYKPSTGYVPGSMPPRFDPAHVKLTSALGSDGVARLDGRLSLFNLRTQARAIAKARGFPAFVVHRGDYSRAFALTGVESVATGQEVQPYAR